MSKVSPFLWFDSQAEEAANLYVSIFPNSRITNVARYGGGEGSPGPGGSVMTVSFELDGVPVTALNGGPHFKLNEAFSMFVNCADQAEVDYYWDTLTADGGEEGQCGWLKDKYGLSWQVVPVGWEEILSDPASERCRRATQALYGMKKIDLAALYAAADGALADD